MASITLALWLVLLWNFLLTTDVGPERVSVLGRTVDIELGFYEWEGEGRLVAEAWRFHLGEEPDCDLPAPIEGGWMKRWRVADHLVIGDGRYHLPTTGLDSLPEDCCLAVGLPAEPELYVWSLGIRGVVDRQFIFVVDESAGVEWHGDDPDGDPDLHVERPGGRFDEDDDFDDDDDDGMD